jgi:hypothetical protein
MLAEIRPYKKRFHVAGPSARSLVRATGGVVAKIGEQLISDLVRTITPPPAKRLPAEGWARARYRHIRTMNAYRGRVLPQGGWLTYCDRRITNKSASIVPDVHDDGDVVSRTYIL